MTKDEATWEINMALIDSGNSSYDAETARPCLVKALAEAKRNNDEYVFIKPPSGSEVEIPTEIVEAAYNG